jgi:hypothetical protein
MKKIKNSLFGMVKVQSFDISLYFESGKLVSSLIFG